LAFVREVRSEWVADEPSSAEWSIDGYSSGACGKPRDRRRRGCRFVFLTVTPAAVHRGHTVLIRGSAGSCPIGDTVTIISRAFPRTHEFAGVPAVLTKVRSGGHFRATTRIPLRRREGRYDVSARCGGGNLGVAARLSVLR
jgi:hypothetical protein